MSANDGGNAFPVADYDHMAFQPADVVEHKRQLSGMSLRDYFAAKALQGLASNKAFIDSSDSRSIQYTAEAAYQLADVMLSIRE
jgi:hypothetical protein